MPKADAAAGRTPPLSSWLLTAAAGRGGNGKSSAQVGWKGEHSRITRIDKGSGIKVKN